jgi:protein SCO1/2
MTAMKGGDKPPQSSYDFRSLLRVALVAGAATTILLTIWSVGPELWSRWHKRSIERALAAAGQSFRSQSSWPNEYDERVAQPRLVAAVSLLAQRLDLPASIPAEACVQLRDGEQTTFARLQAATLSAPVESEADKESRLAVIRDAPEFTLQDQNGGEFRMSSLKGKVVLVSFIFTTCSGSCPATTHRMSLVQRELNSRGLLSDSRVHLLSITLDPARDTPDVLRGYMRLYDAHASHWSFLTGPANDVQKTVEAWGMWARPAANGQLDHPSRIFLVDGQRRIREVYNLNYMKPEWVTDDIKLLLNEATR